MYSKGGPYISAVDGPGGPILGGDRLRRDRATVNGGNKNWKRKNSETGNGRQFL